MANVLVVPTNTLPPATVGAMKRNFLHYSRSPEEFALMRAIKRAMDPNGILNPGKVLL
jgi:FAD/FMN-containing dehydrogenase